MRDGLGKAMRVRGDHYGVFHFVDLGMETTVFVGGLTQSAFEKLKSENNTAAF